MYERFTDRARKVMQFAHHEAHRFNHNYIATEHILLGLIKEGSGVAALALKMLGVELQAVRNKVQELVPGGADMVTIEKLPPTPRAKKVAEYAMEEARRLNHNYVGTEHLLLGLLREKDGVACQVLVELGASPAEVRREVLDLLGHGAAYDIAIIEGLDGTTEAVSAAKEVEPQSTPASPPRRKVGRNGHLTDAERTAVIRILDASANRAAEGLRVVEDYLRFVLDDPLLTEEAKTLRHDLAAAVAMLDRGELIAARDIRGDVGVEIKTDAETRRECIDEVLAANLHRAAQALRSLGEYAKVVAPHAAPQFETIRYHIYQLESTLAFGRAAAERLADVKLYVLIDGRSSPGEFVALVDALLAAGVHAIQLRDKRLSDRDLVERGRALRERITRFGASTLFVLNDRPDLAVLADADGVHVGQEELSVADVRKIIGPRRLVGVSTHSLEQARRAVLDGASYIGVGPTFPSRTKEFAEFPGVALLAEVAASIRLPAFAIGGVTLDNVDRVLSAGIRRVAVASAITEASDAAAEVGKWLARLDESHG